MSWDGRAFSLRLMQMLKLRGLTLGGACSRAGIERGGKYKWLEGNPPRPDMMVRMAAVLGCSPGYLLFRDPAKDVVACEADLMELAADCGQHILRPSVEALERPAGKALQWTGPVP